MLPTLPERKKKRRTRGGLAFSLALWFFLILPPAVHGQSAARIVAPDKLVLSEQEVHLEAYLYRKGLLGVLSPAVQGEVLRFFDEAGNLLGEKLTDASGMARTPIRASRSGVASITIRLAENPRFRAEPSAGRIFTQKKGCPLLFVLVEGALTAHRPVQPFFQTWTGGRAVPGSRERLEKLSPSHNLVYLSVLPKLSSWQAHQWLDGLGYPSAPLVPVQSSGGIQEGEEPSPETEQMETLWQDRSLPAYLVTGNRAFAEAAAKKGLRAYLLVAKPQDPAPGEEPAPSEEPAGLKILREWHEFEPGRGDQAKPKNASVR